MNNSFLLNSLQPPCLKVLSVSRNNPELKNRLCSGIMIDTKVIKANKTQTSPQGTRTVIHRVMGKHGQDYLNQIGSSTKGRVF